MWNVTGNDIKMCVGDWGVRLPITITGVNLTASDAVKFTVKAGENTIVKDYTNIVNNTIDLEFTESETALLPVGTYPYSLDWYQDGAFLCNIIPTALLKVVDKA